MRKSLMITAILCTVFSFLMPINSYGQLLFDDSVNYNVGNEPRSVFSIDLNGDGDNDLVTANALSDSVSILINNGNGTFLNSTNYSVGDGPYSVFSIDFDGDGDNDLVTANRYSDDISILLNYGNGTFEDSVNYAVIYQEPRFICSADLDGDGDNDLAVLTCRQWDGHITSKCVILKNNGDGTFQVTANINTGGQVSSVCVIDLEGDGDNDLAITDMLGGNIVILKNNGDAVFEVSVIYSNVGSDPVSIFASDLDGDGDSDLAVANSWYWNEYSSWVSILINNGDGTFQPAVNYETGNRECSVFASDLDGDGDNDIAVVSSNSHHVSILENNCDGTFHNAGNYAVGSTPTSVFVTDLNGDGRNDIVTANRSSYDVSILLNQSTPNDPPIPTFLVHGLSDDANTWDTMKTWLENNGQRYVYTVDNLEPCGVVGETSFSGNAALLANYINSTIADLNSCLGVTIDTINIVGHSMGGLIARRYVSPASTEWTAKNVRHLIMLGTPNKGSNVASVGGPICPGPAIPELTSLSMLVFNLSYPDNTNTNYYSVWGSRGDFADCYGSIPGLFLFHPNDGIVSRNSAVRDESVFFFRPIYDNNQGGYWCHTGGTSYLEDENLFSSYINPILNDQNPSPSKASPMEETADMPPQLIDETAQSIAAGSSITESLYVEPNGNLTIALFASDSLLSFSLESPSGVIYDSSTPSGYYDDGLGTIGFNIENAEEGDWNWTADASSASTTVEAMVLAGIDNTVILTADQNLEHVTSADTLAFNITVTDNSIGVLGLSVIATPIWNGVDTLSPITLLDDGLHGDLLANDGIYGVLLTSLDAGSVEYKINATGVAPSGNINRIVSIFAYSDGPLIADFTADPTNVYTGNPIQFTDESTGAPTSWIWDFGDGNTSDVQNPTHTYAMHGTYSVSLTVGNGTSTDVKTITDMIVATKYIPEDPLYPHCSPNPFNPITIISYKLDKAQSVKLEIFDLRGHRIDTLVDKVMGKGVHRARFDGSSHASGVYFYKLSDSSGTQTHKMLLLK